jgi:2-keto-4-pentenoate hydratase/2-oxohepta-3-ene-1,7-dioic acid hydratase in catechol pathway
MKWIRCSHQGRTFYGTLEDDRVHEVSGTPFDRHEKTGVTHALADVRIEVPVTPPTFYCVGLNYVKHIGTEGMNIPNKPDVGYRANNALIAHGQDVIMPADATCVHYEGELVVVIGKKARNLSRAEARSCILGYTIGNDVSERNWQKSDRTFWRSKNTDTFKPMGPWIETDVNFDGMQTVVTVNGKESTRFDTGDMLFGIDEFISTMTRYLTLYPGDIIWMGTDGHSPDLQPGDVVDVSITGLGVLRNRFVRGS